MRNNLLFLFKDAIDRKSRSASPSSSIGEERIQTPIRRSRRLSERSKTPSREVSEEPIDREVKKMQTQKMTTPKKLGRASSNPKTPSRSTPRKSPRKSGKILNEGPSITILETLVEDDEEKAEDNKLKCDLHIGIHDALKNEDAVSLTPISARITRSQR